MQTDRQSQESSGPELTRASESPRPRESGLPIELVFWLLLLICGLLQLKIADQLERQGDDPKQAPAPSTAYGL